jgi:hypothetical protein
MILAKPMTMLFVFIREGISVLKQARALWIH